MENRDWYSGCMHTIFLAIAANNIGGCVRHFGTAPYKIKKKQAAERERDKKSHEILGSRAVSSIRHARDERSDFRRNLIKICSTKLRLTTPKDIFVFYFVGVGIKYLYARSNWLGNMTVHVASAIIRNMYQMLQQSGFLELRLTQDRAAISVVCVTETATVAKVPK